MNAKAKTKVNKCVAHVYLLDDLKFPADVVNDDGVVFRPTIYLALDEATGYVVGGQWGSDTNQKNLVQDLISGALVAHGIRPNNIVVPRGYPPLHGTILEGGEDALQYICIEGAPPTGRSEALIRRIETLLKEVLVFDECPPLTMMQAGQAIYTALRYYQRPRVGNWHKNLPPGAEWHYAIRVVHRGRVSLFGQVFTSPELEVFAEGKVCIARVTIDDRDAESGAVLKTKIVWWREGEPWNQCEAQCVPPVDPVLVTELAESLKRAKAARTKKQQEQVQAAIEKARGATQ